MIAGAQPKVLVKLNDNNELLLDPLFAQLFETEVLKPKYKLVRERDGLTKTSRQVTWLEFKEDGTYKASHDDIAVDLSLLMSPFGPSFTWQTTPVTEIIDKQDNYIKFNTKNSVYELFKLED
jgi:hypothetical protein